MLQPWRCPSAKEKSTKDKKRSKHLHANRTERNSKPSMDRRIKLKSLNPHITCKLCRGYLVDATTVTECLHTFCKSCLVKHLEDNNTCPTCDIVIHQSHPLQYISFDRTMQDIVFKIVPNLQENEYRREKDFYRSRGLPYPKLAPAMTNDDKESEKSTASSSKDDDADYHRADEQVNICLECSSVTLKHLKRKFIRCSAQATITHLKKYIAKKVFNNLEKYKDVDILCNEEILGKDHTLKFVCVTRWRFKGIAANQQLGFIQRVFREFVENVAETVYATLVRSMLEYCTPIWNSHSHIQDMEMVQRWAARFVKGSYQHSASMTEMLHSLNWDTLRSRRGKVIYEVIQAF